MELSWTPKLEKVLDRNCPHKLDIETEVFVNDDIPERDDLLPRDLRVSISQLAGNAASTGLAEQCQTVQNCALHHQVLEKSFPTAHGKIGDQFDLLDRIEQP